MRVPMVVIVPKEHYEMLAQIARLYLEQLRNKPEESMEYKALTDALTDWEWWDGGQRERGLF